jgi:NitT/TauT family transport system substrate-binding protein
MWAHMKKIGYADGEPDFSKVIDTSLYLEALQELRKEQPDEPFWEKLEQRYKDQNL